MNKQVHDYFDTLPSSRKSHMKSLHDVIMDCFPTAAVDMRYKMPTYRHGDGWVAIANQKNYVSLYTCSALHLEEFRNKHPEYKTGKGCINFREKDEIPISAIKAVVQHAILHPKG